MEQIQTASFGRGRGRGWIQPQHHFNEAARVIKPHYTAFFMHTPRPIVNVEKNYDVEDDRRRILISSPGGFGRGASDGFGTSATAGRGQGHGVVIQLEGPSFGRSRGRGVPSGVGAIGEVAETSVGRGCGPGPGVRSKEGPQGPGHGVSSGSEEGPQGPGHGMRSVVGPQGQVESRPHKEGKVERPGPSVAKGEEGHDPKTEYMIKIASAMAQIEGKYAKCNEAEKAKEEESLRFPIGRYIKKVGEFTNKLERMSDWLEEVDPSNVPTNPSQAATEKRYEKKWLL